MATSRRDRSPSPSPSQLPPVPGSPSYSVASTANPLSQFNLPLPPPPQPSHAVLTKADLDQSQHAYSELVATAKSYRVALAALSTAASSFGSALESCARLKEARAEAIGPAASAPLSTSFTTKGGSCTADVLMSASGVHHLIANHHQILSETVYRNFEVPLLHELDKWQREVDDEEETYQRAVRAQSKEIRRLEKEGLKLHKQRRRDVARFRAHLVQLTTKLDGLTTLHADHSRTLLRDSQETSAKILDASCSLVRAEVDIFEGLARKGWTGGGLDELLEKGVDLFAPDDVPGQGGGAPGSESAKLFSILPPKSILADSSSDSARARSETLADPDRYQSLAGVAVSEGHGRGGESDSLFSEFNRSRGVRPFSPQPIRRCPTDVTFDSLGVGEPSGPKDDADSEGDVDSGSGGPELKMPAVEEGLPGAEDHDEESPWKDERGRSPVKEDAVSEESSREGDDRGRSWTDVRDETA
ncbi:related to IVY1 - phospholipid-binding protein [Cephalotrichum gorgonifer]|uniref:Related to IVY1 - phospholipid-binding protein n=1 Tax=Cephalotrichum gorgonifer TaxID=2041049 RepID=A0AAE8MSX7_9PEZI|nr:related to IVY1 - phospholipid-binding protein [Cephalotrichum gorgonifer]